MTIKNNDFHDILSGFDFSDPIFDLQLTEINKMNFDPTTPADFINNSLKNYKNNFTVAHLNARSLNKNIFELKEVIHKTNFDVLCISESWLTENTPRDRFCI